MESLELRAVSRIYTDAHGAPFRALDAVSLSWRQGDAIAIMGESGSGKSTLARLALGLERPTSGKVLIDGEDTTHWRFSHWRKWRQHLQAVFQDASGTLNPAWSCLRNVEEALRNLTPLSPADRRERVRLLMARVGLDERLLRAPVRRLSGGEQRRLALVRALAVEPAFLILDEVTAGLDLLATEAVLDLLVAYRRTNACALLVITHDDAVASRLCDTRYTIARGHLGVAEWRVSQNL